jgi:hypothetical protein
MYLVMGVSHRNENVFLLFNPILGLRNFLYPILFYQKSPVYIAPSPAPSPRRGEGKGEGRFQIFLVRILGELFVA